MLDKDLQRWITQARSGGLSDAQIRKELKKNRWNDGQIQEAINAPTLPSSPASRMAVSSKHKRLGLLFICLPFAVLIFCLLAWAVVVFFTRSASGYNTTISIIQWLLGFVSLLSVISIFVLIPLGIVFLTKKSSATGKTYDERSGKGELSEVPPEIHGWNWGAGMLTWVWGIYYNAWISLLCFVPIVNIFWWIVAGINGNEWAWKANQWESVEQFKESQNKWKPWGIAILVLQIFPVLIIMMRLILSIAVFMD